MRISDWSSDVCSSDLFAGAQRESGDKIFRQRRSDRQDADAHQPRSQGGLSRHRRGRGSAKEFVARLRHDRAFRSGVLLASEPRRADKLGLAGRRSEEHTSEVQSLMRISYAVFCLKKKKHKHMIKFLT